MIRRFGVSIQDIPGEPGNTAIVLEARRESAGGLEGGMVRQCGEGR